MDSSLVRQNNNPPNLFSEMRQVRQARLEESSNEDSLLFSAVGMIALAATYTGFALLTFVIRPKD